MPAAIALADALSWVDITALSVLLVFFVLGVFKGLLWQISRVGILLLAYAGAVEFGQPLADLLLALTHGGPLPPTEEARETSIYVAYVAVFLGVVVLLSLLALVLQKLIKKAGLGFYDRLGGGLLGMATGVLVVLLAMMLLQMIFPQSRIAEAAGGSHAMRLTRSAIDLLGGVVPDEIRELFPPEPRPKGQGKTDIDNSSGGAGPVPAVRDAGRALGVKGPWRGRDG